MTTPTRIEHGTATWWVLQTLRDFGPTSHDYIMLMGTHETKDAIQAVRNLHMVTKNHDANYELQPKGRNALNEANKNRPKPTEPTMAGSRTLVNAGSRLPYVGNELAPFNGRPGCMKAFDLPSLQGTQRVHYRTGEVIA